MPDVFRNLPARFAQALTPFNARDVILCLPGFALCVALAVGLLNATDAVIASGAAFSVAMGASYQLAGHRWGAMAAAMVGTTVAAFIGTLAGQFLPLIAVLVGFGAAITAYFGLTRSDAPWWISVQIVIALLVASAFASGVDAGLHRAAFVALGGAAQLLCVMAVNRLMPNKEIPPDPLPYTAPAQGDLDVHMLHAAASVSLAFLATRLVGLPHAYWAPIAALLILKPGLAETRTRGMARLMGTVLGGALASLYALAVGSSVPLLVLGVALSAGAAFGFKKASYVTMTCAITATIVLLITIALGGGVLEDALQRTAATLFGGAITLAIAYIHPITRPS